MGKNIKQQLTYAVRQSTAFGQSKHTDKGLGKYGVRHDGRTYSYRALSARLDVAKNFAGYMKETHPEIRMARDITGAHVNEFLTIKSTTSTQATLDTYAANLRSVLKEVENTYRCNIPDRTAINAPRVDREPWRTMPMRAEDISRLHASYKPGSNGDKALVISHATGARAEEICGLRRESVRFVREDLAQVHFSGNITKGGRDRIVDVTNPHDIRELHRVVEITPQNGRIVPIKHSSLQKSVERHMKELGVKDRYKFTSVHAMRKEWAQRTYDRYRHDHNKYETIKYTNVQLGHGADRDVVLLERYCENIW